jgi:hypothetical protein
MTLKVTTPVQLQMEFRLTEILAMLQRYKVLVAIWHSGAPYLTEIAESKNRGTPGPRAEPFSASEFRTGPQDIPAVHQLNTFLNFLSHGPHMPRA